MQGNSIPVLSGGAEAEINRHYLQFPTNPVIIIRNRTYLEGDPMSVRPEVIAANTAYAESFGNKGSLALPPARHFAI